MTLRMSRRWAIVMVGSLLWLGFSCVTGFGNPPDDPSDADGAVFATVGQLIQYTGSFCCTPGYRFALDGNLCGAYLGILSGPDLELYVGQLVLITGRLTRCPPAPGCLCESDLNGESSEDVLTGGGRYSCAIVETIDVVDRCPLEVE